MFVWGSLGARHSASATVTNDMICRVALGRKYRESDMVGKRFERMVGEFVGILGGVQFGGTSYRAWVGSISSVGSTVRWMDRGCQGVG